MSINGLPLYMQNNIKEDAAVPERPQATQQRLGVPSAMVGLAGALLGERLQRDLEGLHFLLLTRHLGQNLLGNQRAEQLVFPEEQLVSVRLISSFKTHCHEHKLQVLTYKKEMNGIQSFWHKKATQGKPLTDTSMGFVMHGRQVAHHTENTLPVTCMVFGLPHPASETA